MELEVLEEDLICAICRDIFTDPVTLPCGHSYCQECTRPLRKSRAVAAVTCEGHGEGCFSCPLCLAPCEAGIRLRRNVLLHNIARKVRQTPASCVKCSICKGQRRLPAEKSCVVCRESFCVLHIMPHLENQTFRQHALVSPQADVGRLCKHHGKELELYCRTDSTPLCVLCILPNKNEHQSGHDVVRLGEAMDAVKEGCQVKLHSVRDSLAQLTGNLQKLEEIALISKDRLADLQQGYLGFMGRIKLFLQVEENAWLKRLSVAMVTESGKITFRMETLKQLQRRLQETERTLQQVQAIKNPLALIQVLENVDSCDLSHREVCSAKLQELMEGLSLQPAAFHQNSPLFHTLQKAFAGEQIRFDPKTAHPRLRMDMDRTALWVGEESSQDHAMTPVTFDPCGGDSIFYSALGAMPLTKGIHYWEVDVRGVACWALGVAYENSHMQAWNSASCWLLFYRRDTQQFRAVHQNLVSSFKAAVTPGTVGLLVDLDSGILCFYDAKLLQGLHTFYCRFTSPVFPLFCLAQEEQHPSAPPKISVLHPVCNPQTQ